MASERTPLLASSFVSKSRLLWRAGAIFATAGVIAGAFGAHALKSRPGMDADKVHSWETAAHYSIYNGLALMALSMNPRFAVHRFAGPAIAIGGFVFSSSIVALVLNKERFKVLGPVTPMGGALMIAGYLSLIL